MDNRARQPHCKVCKHSEGNKILDIEKQIERWSEYIELFTDYRAEVNLMEMTYTAQLLKEESKRAIKFGKNGKVVGRNKIHVEKLKLLDLNILSELFNKIR